LNDQLSKDVTHRLKKFEAIKPPMIIISGSTQNFEKERQRIMEFIGELEWGAHTVCSNCEVSSKGSALGWEFFHICFDPDFWKITCGSSRYTIGRRPYNRATVCTVAFKAI
jgi:hypothetical protein